ncbi:putative polyketide synthase [Neurospora tetraspora]|uniref:Polyketide synthase n=1 Tax=Neurospora tetraspora TaxID=94610 RepID=A0AAE0JJ66_9PEZI|nr:putative polyketide synthase [Neurospora tetraspora]
MSTSTQPYKQDPIAIIGFACRLPGGNHSPSKLWDFLEQGKVASNKVPKSRFNMDAHYDGSHKPGTMRPPGGMFLSESIPLDHFDASFFSLSGQDATALDPNQRQLLEVVYEGLENAGVPLEAIDGAPVACFVASFVSDYGDMQNRDPEDFPANISIGVGRAIQANRISHFLNLKGPSVTLDTGCSGSLVGLDMAVRAVQTQQADAAIVASSNLYLNPDHVVDNRGTMGKAHSPSGLCHTFDALADGYIKAEGVGCVIIKRLSDAVRDRDPIRAIVLGTATNSNGRTNGISSPSAEAQAAAIRAAYQNAGITDLNDTQYLECHGTGTPAGDPTEVRGVGHAFAATRDPDRPLIIGSIKGNVGHSEPVAGLSGLIKTILAIEHSVIPGNPLFVTPNPHIDFLGNKVKVSRTALPWPDTERKPKRASINSFGYGGANAHAIIQEADIELRAHHVNSISYANEGISSGTEEIVELDKPYTIVLSVNDASSLKNNIQSLVNHLGDPRAKLSLADLAYTLSDRRTRLWHRAFVTTRTTKIEASDFTIGKKADKIPKIGFVFTGQGAQWPQMGKQLLEFFPWTRSILEELDTVLQGVPNPPKWSLVEELTEPRSAEHVRKPEFSQPLVTALQLCIIALLESWGIKPSSVVGHSSGEIAAAYTAGFLGRAGAIKTAFYRGWATVNQNGKAEPDVGMLAVGLGVEGVAPFLEKHQGKAWIACYNSPQSLTISGKKDALIKLADEIKGSGSFARLLQVDLAYHSQLMGEFGDAYEDLLTNDQDFSVLDSPSSSSVTMFSSVTAQKLTDASPTNALYWKTNMISPVRFNEALTAMAKQAGDESPDFLIEIGPSGALAGPISQVLKSLPNAGEISYCAAWARGDNAAKALHDVAGRLFVAGFPISLSHVNQYDDTKVRTVVDLPNYSWNHSVKYWHENATSRDWRFRKFAHHDLIGSKILGTPWQCPIWRKHLRLEDVPWLRDHQIGLDVLMPGAGLVTMAVEAMYQKHCSLNPEKAVPAANELAYQLRHIHFDRALVVEENKTCTILLTLTAVPDNKEWDEFRISTSSDDVNILHCWGRIRVIDALKDKISGTNLEPLDNPTSFSPWYKALSEANVFFGPSFRKVLSLEATSGEHSCRALVDLTPPLSRYEPASYFPIHPAPFDASFQVGAPPNVLNERSLINDVVVPGTIDEVILNRVPKDFKVGLAIAKSGCKPGGYKDETKGTSCDISLHDPETGSLYFQARGMTYVKIDVERQPDPHTFDFVSWKPDISLLTQDQLMYLDPEDVGQAFKVDAVIDLIAHKKPLLRVLEVNLDEADTSSLWFSPTDMSSRLACSGYGLATTRSTTMAALKAELGCHKDAAFHLISPDKKALGLVERRRYDLVIVKSHTKSGVPVKDIMANIKPILREDAFVLIADAPTSNTSTATDSGYETSDGGLVGDSDASSSLGSSSGDSSSEDGNDHASSVSSAPMSRVEARKLLDSTAESFWSRRKQLDQLASQGFENILEVTDSGNVHYLCKNKNDPQPTSDKERHGGITELPRHLTVVGFKSSSRPLPPSLHEKLEYSGWTVTHQSASALDTLAAPNTTVFLVLDELSSPVLAHASGRQWESFKRLVASGNPVVWVTKGSQYQVTDPDNALAHGLFRVVRREDTTARLTTLDVQSATSLATAWVVDKVLELVRANKAETEYAERHGVVYVQRLMPDEKANAFRQSETEEAPTVVKGFHKHENTVQLETGRSGNGRVGISSHGDIRVPVRPVLRTLQLREDASYLIIGGLKGLCGSLAIHMARHGAKHIISCSRSGTSDAVSTRIIKGCDAYGCAVTEAKGDVASPSFVRSLFKQYRRGWRIAGIIQGAMVLRDKTYETMTVEDFRQVLEAKVKGTWNLHKAALEQGMTLDFFTMLSSVSGIIGNKGQANYAAANTFLDAFASYRRGLGLRANSVDLGAIEDVGYLAEQGAGLEARFDKQQWTPIGERVLRRILTCSILQQDAVCPLNPASISQLITGIAFPLPLDESSDIVSDPRFGYLFSSSNSAVSEDDLKRRGSDHGTVDQALQEFKALVADGADSAALVKACVDVMSRQLSRLLRLETDMESGKPLSAYGLDSMSAVELRSWVRGRIGAEVSTLDITNARSLIALCEKVVERLAG